ncbi:MAG: NucA/NucB deoxyribonuclease domain-containing protein [Actinomycetales bacterium]
MAVLNPRSQSWTTSLYFRKINAWGPIATSRIRMQSACFGGCSITPKNAADTNWFTPTTGWQGIDYDVRTLSTNVTVGERFAIWLRYAPNGVDYSHWTRGTQQQRCDSQSFSLNPPPGCVYPDYTPTFRQSLADPKTGPAVLVDWDGQRQIAGHPGSRALGGAPLHKDRSKEASNRSISCPKSLIRPPGMDCDEYPYASTREGAAAGTGYVSRMIDSRANQSQGARLGIFYAQNRVIDGDAFWVEITSDPLPSSLASGQTLNSGQHLTAPSGGYTNIMQTDGNVVIYDARGAQWNTRTSSQGARLVMQTDGNLVLYSATNQPLWNAGTYAHPGAWASFQDDGNFVVYSTTGSPLWWSGVIG